MKIVINNCWGGFSLSDEAITLYKSKKGIAEDAKDFWDRDIERNDPTLIEVVEELENSSGSLASLSIVEIPDGIEWYIYDYDGMETIHENHRSWS